MRIVINHLTRMRAGYICAAGVEANTLQHVRPVLLGFAAETEDVELRAREKLERKGADLIFANRVGGPEGGFADTRNAGVLVDREGETRTFPLAGKGAVAHGILDRVVDLLEAS